MAQMLKAQATKPDNLGLNPRIPHGRKESTPHRAPNWDSMFSSAGLETKPALLPGQIASAAPTWPCSQQAQRGQRSQKGPPHSSYGDSGGGPTKAGATWVLLDGQSRPSAPPGSKQVN